MSSARPSETAAFKCGTCDKAYKRLDHLARHVRSHTQSKPYKCHICTKAFGRTDLLKRHLASHQDQDGAQGSDPATTTTKSIREIAGRVSRACKPCAIYHLRCSEEKPCQRCSDKGIQCSWDGASADDCDGDGRQANSLESVNAQADASESATPLFPSPPIQSSSSMMLDVQIGAADPKGDETIATLDFLTPRSTEHSQGIGSFSGIAEEEPFFLDVPDLNLLLGHDDGDASSGQNLASYGSMEEVDLQFLRSYNDLLPFEIEGSDSGNPQTQTFAAHPTGQDPGGPAAICSEAFRNSHWRFRPNAAHDYGGAEVHNLSAGAHAENNPYSSRLLLDAGRVTGAVKLRNTTRDQVVALVAMNCLPADVEKAVSCFPSTELLGSILQFYLTSPVANAASFIHVPTFDPNEQAPELLAAIAAAGAVLTLDPVLVKLGHAIQECVRIAIPKKWEQNNATIRDMQLSQAFLIVLEVGMWSAQPRKVEISESFLQPVLTMLRRDGRFKSSPSKAKKWGRARSEPLTQQWHEWAQAESFKRLACRLFLHDTNTSMSLLVNPLVSYVEFTVQLPLASDLWMATTAEDWMSRYEVLDHTRALTVASLLSNPQRIYTHANSADIVVASLAALSAAWGLVWQSVSLNSLQRQEPGPWSTIITTSRLDELAKLLNALRISISSNPSLPRDITMRSELNLLHLHMPLEEIQIFAGSEELEKARAVHESICKWVWSEPARRSLFHAGQILRGAKGLPAGAICGPNAIMVYHACLAFWAHGLSVGKVARHRRQEEGMLTAVQHDHGANLVRLDGEDSLELQRFLLSGIGEPCIRSVASSEPLAWCESTSETDIAVEDGFGIMGTIMGVVRANFAGLNMPRLATKLLHLMLSLQKSCQVATIDTYE